MSHQGSPGPGQQGDQPSQHGSPAPPDKDDLTIVALQAIIAQLRNSGPPPKKDKIDQPVIFDGKVKSKLPEFLVELEVYFDHNCEVYDGKDKQKVTFAGTRLGGQPRSWFMNQRRLKATRPLEWFTDYDAFTKILQARFGIRDEEDWAESHIRKLRMTDDQRLDDFLLKFKLYKDRIHGWSPRTWYGTLFTAVAPRIHNWIGNLSTPVPTEYDAFRELITVHDENYQIVKNHNKDYDKDKETTKTTNSGTSRTSGSSSTSRSKPSGSRTSGSSSTSTSASTSTSSSTPSSSDKKRTTPAKNTSDSPLAKVLTPSGHLTPEEKEHRRREGLCTYCGEAGHFAAKCPKNSSKPKETKARATATISKVSDNEEDSENASDA